MENRRNDKRMLLPDLQIRVRKHSSGSNATYIDCTPIDISFNGLAFSSTELSLSLLQKIDIQLSVGSRVIEGIAVVCDIGEVKKATRYGIIYIDINPSIEELFSHKTLSSAQVQELAISMADSALIDVRLNEDEQHLRKAQVLLFDGVEAFKNRIHQRTKNSVDSHGKPLQLAEYFEFSTDLSMVTVPIKNTDGNTVSRRTIKPVLDSNKQVHFKMDNDRIFATLLEFFQELSDTFEFLVSKSQSNSKPDK